MKRWIHAAYIPDITERYPEGMNGAPELEEEFDPDNSWTLDYVLEHYQQEVEDGDYYSKVVVMDNGKCIYNGNSLDDVAQMFKHPDQVWVKRWTWYDEDITITLW